MLRCEGEKGVAEAAHPAGRVRETSEQDRARSKGRGWSARRGTAEKSQGDAEEIALVERLGRRLFLTMEMIDPTDVPLTSEGDADWYALDRSDKAVYLRCASALLSELEGS